MASTDDFLDIEFPDDIAFGASGGPRFNTSIAITRGGREVRNRNWDKARLRWNVAHGIKNQAEYDALVAFFYVVGGRDKAFKYHDHTDDKQDMVNQTTPTFIAQGDGLTTVFQLIKRYSVQEHFYDRFITRPVRGSVRLFLSRDTDDFIENFTDWNIDHDTGLITFGDETVPLDPNDEIWGLFNFRVPVRFDNDAPEISLDDYQNYNWPNIDIIEEREP